MVGWDDHVGVGSVGHQDIRVSAAAGALWGQRFEGA